MKKDMPELKTRLRMSFPTSNRRERAGAVLYVEDAASGLLLAELTLTDADLLDLLASRGVEATGRRTPHLDCIGKESHNVRVNVSPRGYFRSDQEAALKDVLAWTEQRLMACGARHTRRDRNQAGYSVVGWWYGDAPNPEIIATVQDMARNRLTSALGEE